MTIEKESTLFSHDELADIQDAIEIAIHQEFLQVRKIRRNRALIQSKCEADGDEPSPDELINISKVRKKQLEALREKVKFNKSNLVKRVMSIKQ